MKYVLFALLGAFGGFVSVASAQNFSYPNRVIQQGSSYLNTAITILMVLMTLWFLISVFNFIREKDPAKMKDRKKQVINGVIGLFVAVAVWGIIGIIRNVTGTNTNTTPQITCPPGYRPGLPGTASAGTCIPG